MGIFKAADPEANLRKAIDSERALRDELRSRLTTAQTLVAEHQKAAGKLHHDLADEKLVDAAESKQITAEHRVKNLSVTLAETETKLADLESQLAVLTDQKQRAATVAEVGQIAKEFKQTIADLDRALEATALQAEKIAAFVADGIGLQIFTSSARSEIEAAAEMLQALMKSHIVGVTNGVLPAVLAQPVIAAPKAMIAPPPTMRVFATKNISWTMDGSLRLQKQWTDVDLPPEIAQRALRMKAAVPVNHELRRKQMGFASKMTLRPEHCANLDADAPAESDPRAVEPTIFQRVDRGPPIQMKTARSTL